MIDNGEEFIRTTTVKKITNYPYTLKVKTVFLLLLEEQEDGD